MKTIIFAAVILAMPFATSAKTMDGCEIIDVGGYANKVDPTCVFTDEAGGDGASTPDPDDYLSATNRG